MCAQVGSRMLQAHPHGGQRPLKAQCISSRPGRHPWERAGRACQGGPRRREIPPSRVTRLVPMSHSAPPRTSSRPVYGP
eukprot:5452453-Prymnesium_polylepis.1